MKSAKTSTRTAVMFGLFLSGAALTANAQTDRWNGFYVGINAGYADAGSGTGTFSNQTGLSGPVGAGAYPSSFGIKQSGGLIGVQVGKNFALGNNIVVGLETEINYADISGSSTYQFAGTSSFASSSVYGSDKIDWFGATKLRLGYLVNNDIQIYVTGGLAYGGGQTKISNTVPTFPASNAYGSTNWNNVGWTIGAGAEWAFTESLSLRLEYAYLDLGSTSVTMKEGPPYSITYNMSHKTNIFRAGLNYSF